MRQLSSLRYLYLVFIPLLVAFTACDSGGSNGGEEDFNNEFSFTVTPSSGTEATTSKVSQKNLDGFSFFVDTDDIENAEEQAFAIYFSGSESFSQQNATQGLFGFVARQSTQPSPGEYTLTDGADGEPAPSDFIGFLYEDFQSQGSSPFYIVQSGTLTLSESNDSVVSGEITATAKAITIEGSGEDMQYTEEEVEITGEFKAENLDTYVPFGEYTNSPS